jgi:sirohydrochlorin cobaltochelatase
MDALSHLIRAKLETQGATWIPKQDAEQFLSKYQSERIVTPAVVNSAWYPLVGTATLELADVPLHEQIRQFASVALAGGCNQIELLPMFLLPGVHLMEDIPAEVALAKASLGDAIVISLRSHLGASADLSKILTKQLAIVEAEAKILIAHGTRRIGGNQQVQAVAEEMQAKVAYWSMTPKLEEQIKVLADSGLKRIAILPYFLFSGGITDAISKEVTRLQNQFPELTLSLCNPIGVSSELANLMINLIEK